MKKKLLVILVVIIVLGVASISAMAAKPGEKWYAEGVWCYLPTGINMEVVLPTDEYVGDPNKQFASAAYDSYWTGTFSGTSKDYGLAITHGGPPILFIGTSSFEEVDVAGHVGGLEMDAMGDRPGPTADWRGKWIITSGSGELEKLHGQGRFWGPGWPPPEGGTDECPDNFGVIYYSGVLRFR